MDPRSVQAPVTSFLLDQRLRGAALAGPYVHAAMRVLVCAGMVFLMLFLSFVVETWLATTQSVRDDISAALFSMFEHISLFMQLESACSVKTQFARRQVAAGLE